MADTGRLPRVGEEQPVDAEGRGHGADAVAVGLVQERLDLLRARGLFRSHAKLSAEWKLADRATLPFGSSLFAILRKAGGS